jgi:hypothetical protein
MVEWLIWALILIAKVVLIFREKQLEYYMEEVADILPKGLMFCS